MPAPDLAAAVRVQVRAVKDAIGPWHAGYDYYNSEETPAPASAVLPPASYRRLQEIKTACYPDQMIISVHPVQPRRLTWPSSLMFPAGASPTTRTAAARWWWLSHGIGDRRQAYRFLAPMLAQGARRCLEQG